MVSLDNRDAGAAVRECLDEDSAELPTVSQYQHVDPGARWKRRVDVSMTGGPKQWRPKIVPSDEAARLLKLAAPGDNSMFPA